MRNLKKILAMVLALVMSLSLMATAGAADFTDASSINEKYETAIEVLEGLGVFKGYQDGTFQPQGSITRAETAAIIYRIVTGDVKDEQVGIYADYNLFTDVPSTSWFAGYVNYCANAEYIKGVGGGKFNPNAQVTGYAALAMILRAIGYTANGGFTGSDWEVQTARTAEARKITKNILTGTLGQPATRETVAEILFQAILVNMVDHNVDNTFNGDQGYFEKDITLGYKTFKLEQIEGIVMANEFADLNSNYVLGKGKTNLQVADEESLRNLAITTEITDIGESRYAYITGSKVLAMGDTGLNKVTEFGHACDISTASKFSAVAEMPAASDIEYYTNFDRTGHYTCDQRLEFVVTFKYNDGSTYKPNGVDKYANLQEIISDFQNTYVGGADLNGAVNAGGVGMTVVAGNEPETDPASTTVTYSKIIRADAEITQADMNVIRGIFYAADNQNTTTTLYQGVEGDVYVGTRSNNSNDTDWSDELSFRAWTERFINDVSYDINWKQSLNGDWVKFVDNDNDGAAEYAFKTHYNLEEALYTYKDRDDNVVMEFNTFDDENSAVRYLGDYIPAVGDKVLAAWIDNQWLVEPATSENVTVSSYSWRNDEITTDKGTYGQSGITNSTDMLELINTMDDKVEYVVYFDHFGYVRAYELPGGTKYALVTEMYYTNNQQGNLVDNWPMIAELTTLDDEGKTISDEYNVVSGAGTFTANQPWLRVANAVATYNYNNWLQPAIAHLGVDYNNNSNDYRAHKGTPQFAANSDSSNDYITSGAYATFWDANRQLVRRIADNGMNGLEEFNYGPQNFTLNATKGYTWNQPVNASFTNVAVVNINDKDAALTGAAKLSLGKDGKVELRNGEPVYARDYIQLATSDIVADAVRYPIYDAGDVKLPNDTTVDYKAYNNNWVNAVHDTQYFIAYNGGVYAFEDFENFPGLTNKDNKIHAAYAVARNTNSDKNEAPYWVADVIVYEVYDLADNLNQTSVSLAFYTPTRTSGNVQEINTLNSKYGPEVTLIPGERAWNTTAGQWGADWEGYGFYALYNDTEAVDNVMTAKDIARIGAKNTDGTFVKNYTKNNIHAGIIEREAYIDKGGNYIDVDMGNGDITSIEITNKIYSITTRDALSGRDYDYNVATLLRYENQANSQIRKGDMVIWVGGAKTDGTKCATSFVVDLGSIANTAPVYAGSAILEDTPSWLVSFTRDAAGNKVPTRYDSDSTSDLYEGNGEWQKIMREQYTGAPNEYDYTVTVNCVDTTGKLLKTWTEGVNKNGSLFIPESAIKPTSTTIVSVVNETLGGNVTAVTVGGVDGYQITGIDRNMTVKVTLNRSDLDLSLTVTGFTPAAADLQVSVNDAPLANYTSGSDAGTGGDVYYGDTYKFVVKGLDTVQYKYTLTPDDLGATMEIKDNVATITGKITGTDVDLTLTRTANDTTSIEIGTHAGADVTITTKNADGTAPAKNANATVLRTNDVTFKVELTTPANSAIDKVTYTVLGETPVTRTAENGVYTIPAAEVGKGLPITIDVAVKSTAPVDVTFTGTAVADTFMSTDGVTWNPAAATTVAPGSDLLLRVNKDVSLPTVDTAAVVTADPVGQNRNFKVSNITAATQITVDNAAGITALTGASINSADGTITPPTATGTLKYALVNTNPATIISGINVLNNAETAVNGALGVTLGTSQPTIAGSDAGKYLVIADVNAETPAKVVGIVAVEVQLDDPTNIDLTGKVQAGGTVDTVTPVGGGTVYYAVVAGEPDLTSINVLSDEAAVNACLTGATLGTTAPNGLTTADNGKWLVVAELNTGKVTHLGKIEITGVTAT